MTGRWVMRDTHLPPGVYAREVRRSLGTHTEDLPVNLEAIASHLKVEIRTATLSAGVDGCRYVPPDQKRALIILNDTITPQSRVNFTLAHELGHYVLPWHKEVEYICGPVYVLAGLGPNNQEWEANQFAAELIMPEEQFRDAARSTPMSLTSIGELADH